MNIHQHIIAGIKEQLFFNDYLVLPDFGGFVLKTQNSHFSVSGTSILPPLKTIGFNILLKQNDGILTNCLQDKLKCNNQEAKLHLSEFANFCNSVLQNKRRLSLSGIGFFYLDFENNICFEPEHDSNFNTESFGLGAVNIKAIEQEKKETPITHNTFKPEDRTFINESSESRVNVKRRNYTKVLYLTVFAMMLGTFLVFLVNNLNVKGQLRASIFNGAVKSNYVPVPYPDITLEKGVSNNNSFVADDKGIALFSLNENKSIAVKFFENTNNASENNLSNNKRSKYEIILGCFKVMKNAKRLVKQLKKNHINASIKEKIYKGMHVVSVTGINDKIDAIDWLEKIQNLYPKAWMKVN